MNRITLIGTIVLLIISPSCVWAQDTSKREDYTFPLVAVLIVLVFFLMLRELIILRKRVDESDKLRGHASAASASGDKDFSTENLNPIEPQIIDLKFRHEYLENEWTSFRKTLEQQLLNQAEMNFAQRDKLEDLEDRLNALSTETTKINPSNAEVSEQDLQVNVQSILDQHFKTLRLELEFQMIKKLNQALENVSNVAQLELGQVYFAERPSASADGQLNQDLFKEKWVLGKSVYKIVIDHEDANKAYLYLNSRDELSINNAWSNQPQFIAPFFDLYSGEDHAELPALLSKKQKLWKVVEKGKTSRR
jgi:hypothetical protein